MSVVRKALALPIQLGMLAIVMLASATTLACAQSSGDRGAVLLDAARSIFRTQGERSMLALRAVPRSDRVFEITENGRTIAYAASSADLLATVGYSGKPLDIAVFVEVGEKAARLIGARLLAQSEPILIIGISGETLADYVGAFSQTDINASLRSLLGGERLPTPISGATMSSAMIRDAILRTGRQIARIVRAGNAEFTGHAQSEKESYTQFSEVLSAGRLRQRRIGFADMRRALPSYDTLPPGDGLFMEITAGLLDTPELTAALLAPKTASRVEAERGTGETLLFIAARGLYSAKGTGWRRSGYFDRLEIVQGNRTIRLPADRQTRIDRIAIAGAPEFRETFLVLLPAKSGLDVTAPARLDLVVRAPDDSLARFGLDLRPRARAAASVPLAETDEFSETWRLVWEQRAPQLAILTVMLTVLLVVLYFSGPLVRRPEAYRTFRLGFLSVTLIWLGWIAGAQLSIVQVTAFLHALRSDFQWQVFMLDPLVFSIWAFLALTLLFWGRGVYCGWLCPFGAMQELVNAAARRLKIRQLEIPWEIHERLWPIKYLFLIGIIGLSLQETALAFRLAEVEPFKTAITLHFLRPWPFVLYVVAILIAGLFVERVFCRYLCPLGAALSLPTRFKIFDWLIRRPQCGRECRLCAATCTVQAIDPIGRINPNECIYCLRCQVNYHDPLTCVPLKMRAHRRQSPTASRKDPIA